MAPIKRSEYLKPLSREHHYSLLFGWKLRQGISHGASVERMTQYVRYFEKHMLVPHFKEEETCLFIYSDSPFVKQALDEHRHILSVIARLKAAPSMTTYPDLASLATLVDHHVRFEERQLFPYLEENLTQSQLEAVATAIKDGPSVGDDFEDHFWELGKS